MDDRSTVRPRAAGRGFRITAGVLGVLLLLLSVPYAIATIVSSDPDQTIHRFHTTAGALPTAILAVALLVLARRPGEIAAMQLFVAGAIVSTLVGLVAGDLITGLYVVGVVLAAILLALYPARADVWRIARPRVTLLAAAVIAAVPAIAYALTQSSFQRTSLDVHAQMHHYSGVAVAAVALPAAVLVAAIGGMGWRLVGWIAAASFVLFGASTLAFSTYISAPEAVWGWASVVAGAIVLGLTEVEARRIVEVPSA